METSSVPNRRSYDKRWTLLKEAKLAVRSLYAQTRLSFLASVQYRANYLMAVLSVAVSSAVEIALWRLVLQRRGQVMGYGLNEFLVYLILANVVAMLRVNWDSVLSMSEEVRSGAISRHLLKPIPLFFVATGDWLARKIPIFGGALIVVLGLMLWYPLTFHPTFQNFLFFFMFVVVSLWLSAEIYFLIILAAFWVEENSGVAIAFNILGWSFLGVAFPLSFYPVWLQRLLDATPMPYLVYYPVMTLMGKMTLNMWALRWGCAFLMALALRFFRRAMTRVAENRLQTLGG